MNASINGREYTFESGETILQVARRNNIFIPTLCHFQPLDHKPGTCRVCLVEATDKNGRTEMVTSCNTPQYRQGTPHCHLSGHRDVRDDDHGFGRRICQPQPLDR